MLSSSLYFARLNASNPSRRNFRRLFSVCKVHRIDKENSAVIVGCYEKLKLSKVGQSLDKECDGKLSDWLKRTNFKGKPGKTRVFHGLSEDLPCVVVAGLGAEDVDHDDNEQLDAKKENVRLGIGAATKEVKALEVQNAEVDSCYHPSAAAEATTLTNFIFDELKSQKDKTPAPPVFSLSTRSNESQDLENEWNRGVVAGDCQNFARYLMELPSNYKTPTRLAEIVQKRLSAYEDIEVVVRDKNWIEEKKMGCFLGVAQGSVEPPVLIEMKYKKKTAKKTVAVVGKGVTFDTGGISIKPSAKMAEMKGDMGGAACTVACIEAACRLGLDINIVGLVALTENMPSGIAIKPGDVLTAMNGKTVEVDNTDAEGRLILADALTYAHSFDPSTIINIATLTGAIRIALGSVAAGAFTTSTALWSILNEAGKISGDRLWRMPIYKHFTEEMKCSVTADLRNTQKTAGAAGSSTAAAFLKEFVEVDRWAHLDIAGVMSSSGEFPYLSKGMSGRPTRTLIEALEILSKESEGHN